MSVGAALAKQGGAVVAETAASNPELFARLASNVRAAAKKGTRHTWVHRSQGWYSARGGTGGHLEGVSAEDFNAGTAVVAPTKEVKIPADGHIVILLVCVRTCKLNENGKRKGKKERERERDKLVTTPNRLKKNKRVR